MPISNPEIEILILGSMPSEKSLQEQEYYAHPQNRFWRVIATILNSELPNEYSHKINLLQSNKIGLWDVVHQAKRIGSLDSAIEEESPNDIETFILQHHKLKTIAFNGKKSEELFYKYFKPNQGIRYVSLPSTSPANAGIKLDGLCERWKIIF